MERSDRETRFTKIAKMLALFFRGVNRAINENPYTNTIDVNHIENTFRAMTICFSTFSLGIFFSLFPIYLYSRSSVLRVLRKIFWNANVYVYAGIYSFNFNANEGRTLTVF